MNTRSKRASAIRMMRPWMLALPLPDGTIDQADREHTAFGYAGILSAELVVEGFVLHTATFTDRDTLTAALVDRETLTAEVLS